MTVRRKGSVAGRGAVPSRPPRRAYHRTYPEAPGGTEESLGRYWYVERTTTEPTVDYDAPPADKVLYGPSGERLVVIPARTIGFRP